MERIVGMKRMGEIMCPTIDGKLSERHPIPCNNVLLKEGEGIGSKIKIKCGMCGLVFEGTVFYIQEEPVWKSYTDDYLS